LDPVVTPAPFVTALAGALLAAVIFWDAFETILVPRRIGRRVRLTRYFYLLAWRVWRAAAMRIRRGSAREGFLGVFGPLSLLLLLALWAGGLVFAFALLQAAAHPAGGTPVRFLTHLYMSGETFFTLGFGDVTPATAAGRALSVIEAGMGFGFLGTVIGYLPTMYGAFAAREVAISLMDTRAGSPPTAAQLLSRLPQDAPAAACDVQMREWERWAAQLLETHISYPQLAYYRSQHVNQSWLGALVAVLDTSAAVLAGIESLPDREARHTFAMARHALVDITQIFVPHFPGAGTERLDDATFARLRAHLADRAVHLPEGGDYAQRLMALRLMYEPYALALAAFLMFDLPPWIHDTPRRDNWAAGPWDRELAAGHGGGAEEHF
jgi:hypothetical protein